ncbi:MAG TPA: serine hydrolase domain-containing protein [Pirellulales bacterium]|nr:serine hydrolase domain-containing protein [Pirellulales bacterium]
MIPVCGESDADLAPFDELMTSFVTEHQVPGAALAVTKDGSLVYARGFGWADVEAKRPVAPKALFRIASVSKPITAVAVLQLVERGLLKTDDKVLDLLGLSPYLQAGTKPDERWQQITVADCLRHTGGWDRDVSGDPIGWAREIGAAFGLRGPATPADIVRFMMGQPLDFEPGSRFAYSNLGYLVLGRIIEKVTGEKYEAHVKREVLEPLGIRSARLGFALARRRANGEVKYYDSQHRTGPSLWPPHQQVPVQYGVDNLDGFEAHGGWIASAVDLVRFAAAFDKPEACRLLRPATIAEMWSRPAGAAGYEADGRPKAAYYGYGWSVRPVGDEGQANHWHSGHIAGSEALLVRRWDGLDWAVVFNTANTPDGKNRLVTLIDGLIHQAADQVKRWPSRNLFDMYLA